MINEEWVLAIIPGRAGSKRLPNKNLLHFHGKPLIGWAIEHAQASSYIDSVLISSDSQEILDFATGSIIPLRRPAFLASDISTSEALIAHALYHLKHLPDWFILLQPTSPLRTAQDIDSCLLAAQACGCAITTSSGKPNGAVYVSKTELFLETLSFHHPSFLPMPPERSLDINTEQDLA